MMNRVKEIFAKIRDGHFMWVNGDSDYKERLEKAFDPFFIELEQLGVERSFSESLLFFGKKFVDSLEGESEELFLKDEDIERVFSAKVVDMTEKQKRETKLAKKYGASIYQTMPMEGDKVGINVLTHKNK